MASPQVIKKKSLCRYYITYGDCFHGENCQFIHAYPPQESPHPQPAPVEQPPPPPPVPQQPIQQQQQQPQQQQQTYPPQQQPQGYAMNKLVCSFKSDLPNEIDFAMQVATLLANTNNFSWSKDYPLVDAICSSLHVFVCVCGCASTCYCYPKFWHRVLKRYSNDEYLQTATVPPDMDPSFMDFNSLQDHDHKDQRKIYKRIKTAAELIKQFSMTCGTPDHEKNEQATFNYNYHQIKKKKLKASPELLKFVSLLLHCDDTPLNHIGLDILSSTASKLSKVPDTSNDPNCTKLVQMFQEYCVDSISSQDGDIYIVNRSIEVISRLISSSSKRISSNVINLITEKNLVLRIEQFLTSHYDVTLFLSALECCYRISRHQPHLLTSGKTKYLLKILVNLLNCDDRRYFTTTALKRIKLVDEDEGAPKQEKPPVLHQPKPLATTQQRPKQAPQQQQPQPQPQQPQSNETKEYVCEWHTCDVKFAGAKQLYCHVFEHHIRPLPSDALTSCQWSGPSGSGPGCSTQRPKYSLLTHLKDFHCNQAPVKPPEHPGYAPNAALLAIRRHANTNFDVSHHNQSPLSVSVRLTAALVLRNLATESPEMKQALKNHEPLLSEICMTNGRDESKIIAECLSLFSSE